MIPPLRMLPGTTVRHPGDRGVLVLPTEVAQQLRLTQGIDSTQKALD